MSTPPPAVDRPVKITQVKAWVAEHPDVDPEVLAPYPKQRAAERRAALRALGAIGTPAALDVLASYAKEEYSDVELEELHKMWGAFDRREFAARMFKPGAWRLNLGAVTSLEGVSAIENLTSLDLIFLGAADLEPLGECTSLRRLSIISNIEPSITSVEPLTRLPELRVLTLSGVTRNADLSVLAGSPINELKISLDGADGSFLLNLPNLSTVVISGGETVAEDRGPREKWEPTPVPAHEGLAAIVLELVCSGVQVAVYTHESDWVADLREEAEATDGIAVGVASGMLALTNDAATRDRLLSRLRINSIGS